MQSAAASDLDAAVRSLGAYRALRLIESFAVRVDAVKRADYQLLEIRYETSPLSEEDKVARKRIPGT